jgi:hypothetical protein
MKRHVVRKTFRLDPGKVSRTQKVLGAASETESVRMALDRIIQSIPSTWLSKNGKQYVAVYASGALYASGAMDLSGRVGTMERSPAFSTCIRCRE